jgi:hypothetical protein
MGTLAVRVCNAKRQPIDDRMDVRVVSASTDATVGEVRDAPGNATVKFERLADGQPVIVRVFPKRHRAVQQFAIPQGNTPVDVQLFCPLHPDHVRPVTFPDYDDLPAALTEVLERSTISGARGEALYAALGDKEKASFLNVSAKMRAFIFEGAHSVWSFVDRLYGVQQDRIFADVELPLRERVEAALGNHRFRGVSGGLHEPPVGFGSAGSFKTDDPFGNLQLSFFSSVAPPAVFKVDADIDDAAGIGHAFQVIRNFATHGKTHPYDIHQILVFRQDIALPYDLA